MYKFINDTWVLKISDNAFIPFDPANTDYQKFKYDIMDGSELEDAEGNVMSAEEAMIFVSNLP